MPAGRILETAAGTGVRDRRAGSHHRPSSEIVATDLNQADARFRGGRDRSRTRAELQRPTRWLCRSRTGPSIWSPASSARCSSRPDRPLSRGAAGFAAGRPVRVQRLGSDRGKRGPRCRHVTAVATLFPDDPPKFPRAHAARLSRHRKSRRRTCRRPGLGGVEVETVTRRSRAASPRDPAIGFCQGTPLRNEIETRDPSRLGEATDAAAAALAARFRSRSDRREDTGPCDYRVGIGGLGWQHP